MRAFTKLIEQLDRAGSGETSQTALNDYILHAAEKDLNWAIAFLLNARPFPRLLSSKQLLQAAKKAAGVTDWLADACREEVGDVAELAALLVPRATQTPPFSLSALLTSRCLPLRTLDDPAQEAFLGSAWRELDLRSRRIWHRILLGTLRFNVERPALAAALSERHSVPTPLILQRFDSPALSNSAPDWIGRLVAHPDPEETKGWPLPWGQLGSMLPSNQAEVSGNGWICEWIPRGRRLQLVRRTHRTFLWSPEGDLLNRELPELIEAAQALEVGIVLEGIWAVEPPHIDAELRPEPSRGCFGWGRFLNTKASINAINRWRSAASGPSTC